jgi:hypothetical protein
MAATGQGRYRYVPVYATLRGNNMSSAARTYLFVASVSLCVLAVSRAADPTISITISTPHPVVQLGSEMRINIVLKNISPRPIDFWRSPSEERGERSHEVEVRDERGNKMPETKYYRVVRGKEKDDAPRPDGKFSPMVLGGSLLGKTVEPGDTFTDGMILNRLVEITAPGKYAITIHRLDEATKSYINSNTITVTVTK